MGVFNLALDLTKLSNEDLHGLFHMCEVEIHNRGKALTSGAPAFSVDILPPLELPAPLPPFNKLELYQHYYQSGTGQAMYEYTKRLSDNGLPVPPLWMVEKHLTDTVIALGTVSAAELALVKANKPIEAIKMYRQRWYDAMGEWKSIAECKDAIDAAKNGVALPPKLYASGSAYVAAKAPPPPTWLPPPIKSELYSYLAYGKNAGVGDYADRVNIPWELAASHLTPIVNNILMVSPGEYEKFKKGTPIEAMKMYRTRIEGLTGYTPTLKATKDALDAATGETVYG